MNFKKFINEGKAIQITPDMEKFANECNEVLNKLSAQKEIEYYTQVYSRMVDGGKFGKKNVKLIPVDNLEVGFAEADVVRSEILVGFKLGIRYNMVDLVEHELIHMFDPKLTNDKLRQKKWGVDNVKDFSNSGEDYYKYNWEQDAYMAQYAKFIVKQLMWLYDNDVQQVSQRLSQYKPQTDWEKAWHKNPKMWKKYMNTIYQRFQSFIRH